MAKMNASSEIKTFMEEKLVNPIPYSYEYESFATKAEAIQAGKWPEDADEYVLVKVNKTSETAAKAKAYQEATAELRKAYEDTPAYKIKQVVASLTAAGMPASDAQTLAESLVK